jgi:hypothetical protein
MSYITKTNPDEMTFGTSLQGYITAPYAELVELFGKPHDFFDDFKCDAEWYVEFDDGTVATIYNWKNGSNYLGDDAPPVEAITSWNIGGNTPEAAEKVLELSSHYRLNGDRRTRMTRHFKKLDRIQESLDRALANKG